MDRVSSHSGLPESVELRLMAERHDAAVEKRERQIGAICAVLDKMPGAERRAVLAEVIRRYKGRD